MTWIQWYLLISHSYEELSLKELPFKITLQEARLMDKEQKFKWKEMVIFL